jgi:DNA adenine methylase
MGGKYFLGKEISRIMKERVHPDEVDGYLEPFCGALSILTNMNDTYDCFASDYHPDLIELWKSVQNNTFVAPQTMTEDLYNEIKGYDSPNALKAFVGFGCSFGGKFFSGYADKYKNTKKENYLKEITNSIRKKKDKLHNIHFECCSYDEWSPSNMLIYCDPPYRETNFPIKYRTDTKHYDDFDNEHFWDVMREWSKDNQVFVSETSAPADFVPIWTKETHRSASQSCKTRYKNESGKFTNECLFIHESL